MVNGSRTRVYPRRCGGAGLWPDWSAGFRGLSPQVRGSRDQLALAFIHVGSIPAGAGEPFARGLGRIFSRVYPRRCGGAAHTQGAKAFARGLSPQVRGSRIRRDADLIGAGSIPAGAGEPYGFQPSNMYRWVYPRRCGGANWRFIHDKDKGGLSPQVRGSQSALVLCAPRAGSIPAGAGEPHKRAPARVQAWVYPRRCGGARSCSRTPGNHGGLSPQVRGSPPLTDDPHDIVGSIPAGAGEPVPSRWTGGFTWVYPRRCGGAAPGCRRAIPPAGLSPQVRGSLVREITSRTLRGSIPAGAGEPRIFRRGCDAPGVYPRRCGGASLL